MSHPHSGASIGVANRAERDGFDPAISPDLYAGVLTRRSIAFLLDAAAIAALTLIGWALVIALGVITFGLFWLLLWLVFPAVALAYTGFSLGGPHSATPGMRAMGIEMRQRDGGPMFALLAMAHALIFWVSVAALTPLILLVGLFNARKKLAHDFLLGTVVINAHAMRPLR